MSEDLALSVELTRSSFGSWVSELSDLIFCHNGTGTVCYAIDSIFMGINRFSDPLEIAERVGWV